MFYFLKKRAEKKLLKKTDKVISELESVYLDLDYFNRDDINLTELMQWTEDKLDAMAAVIEPNEFFIISNHPEIITRANRVSRIALRCAEAAMKEFQDELAGMGNILA
ncbi:TPA: hypothetical protein ACPZFU_003115 [Yersinia enterocolitica]|uniref:hypothetical protein n=1 Tax=Yersinia enterocolitica TaxID=630 RepID=UPI000327E22E|nr:hypothetical protein [Yersinia enterocolitica]EKN3327545.1 hypothetical protein [Yersinia enterocolitica]EKN3351650.1 hypothetical protein [Yersinia enterocolitica]EKN3359603.1 hypothetical protein [Yersinia enterocolitica]EKN3367004.1 hypothetical protein [Yersinia enterocolitica]EKN3382766.1 hypothetical protein [Yersinia enterocolitica]